MNESKVMQFIEKFDELYAKNKGVIFYRFKKVVLLYPNKKKSLMD